MIDFEMRLTGTNALLMHSSRLANPIDPAAKALKAATSKRKKTDEDHETIAYLEFTGGIYFDSDCGPYIPGENLMRMMVDGGKLTKQGTAITRGVIIKSDVNPLVYRGPRTIEELWKQNFWQLDSVKVTTSRTMRCRPRFPAGWSVRAEGIVDPSVLEVSDLQQIATTAGLMIGLGDWRPRYGRFTAEVTRQ